MVSWLVIPVITLIVTGFGSVIALQFMTPRSWRSLNGLFASVILGVVWAGWLALILAELGLFSLASATGLWLLVFLALLAFAFARSRRTEMHDPSATESGSSGQEKQRISENSFMLILVLWIFAAAWLYFRPHEAILGGADAGVYVSLGAEIAQNGGFNLRDETLADLDPDLRELFLRPLTTNPVASSYLFPGFYVVDVKVGAVTPQFYPLHPVWQAAAFSMSSSAEEGARAELLITGLWMTLASIAIILIARELGGWPAALLMMAGLAVAALQVWFARYPTTEALTQFLLWSGLWALMRWLDGDKPASLWALAAGSALGAVFLVRIDILVLLPIFLLLGVGLWVRGWRKSDWWFAGSFSLLVAHSFLHGVLFSAPYFSEHIGYGLKLLWANWWIIALALLGGVLTLWLLSGYRHRAGDLLRYRKPAALVLIGAFLLYAIYGWFVRPIIIEASFRPDLYSESLLPVVNHENWRRLGWYLSIPGIWLGVAGICLLIWRMERKTAVLVATGGMFSILYLWNVRANPHQIYVMRRYVPVVAPFFLLAGPYFISQLPRLLNLPRAGGISSRSIATIIAVLVGIVWLVSLSWSARGFIRQVDNQGVLKQLAQINDDLPPHSVLLFNDQSPVGPGDFWGTPLKYIFGHDVFTIRDIDLLQQSPLAETIEGWQGDGRTVVWIGEPLWLAEQGFDYHVTTYNIASKRMESSYEHKPQQINEVDWQLEAAFVEPVLRPSR